MNETGEKEGVWFNLEADEDTCYTASTAGSNYDTGMFMYESSCPAEESDAECMMFNDDSQGAITSRLVWEGKSGTHYKIFVYSNSYSSHGGRLKLNVSVRLRDVS